jgi:hypothetical protein
MILKRQDSLLVSLEKIYLMFVQIQTKWVERYSWENHAQVE